LGACVSVQPARAFLVRSDPGLDRPESTVAERGAESGSGLTAGALADAGSVWPTRWGTLGSPVGAIVPSPHGPDQLRAAHLGRFHTLRVSELEYRHAEALAGAVGKDDGFRFEAEGPGSLVFLPPMLDPEGNDEEPTKPDADAPAETVVFVTGTPIEGEAGDTDERIELQRTWIACYDAHPRAEETAGTVLLIPGMLGTPQPIIEGMIKYWRRAGFSVVRLLSHPSRFTERVDLDVGEGDENRAGVELARMYDERTAECAYAAEAGLDHWMAARPALKDKPVVFIGMSGGAIVGPAVIAHDADRYDAAVFIAGGVDFFSISATSNYAEWIDAMTIDWEPDDPDSAGKPTPERLSGVADAYMEASKLDAMHQAPNVGVPTLVMHAGRDRAVPARFGETLWNRLGQPERWVFPVGHELIFVMLPTQADRLDGWIKGAIAGGAPDPDRP